MNEEELYDHTMNLIVSQNEILWEYITKLTDLYDTNPTIPLEEALGDVGNSDGLAERLYASTIEVDRIKKTVLGNEKLMDLIFPKASDDDIDDMFNSI